MADPTQSHGRGAQNFSSSNVRSPLSAGSGSSGTPISFQTNVNRSKTKRWVEAKQYSYDGGDWGDDDEEEEEEVPAVPRPPYATHHTGSSSELVSRRLSGLPFGADEQASANDKGRSVSGGDQKPLPFVRPADLYKRMREEKVAQQSSASDAKGSKPDEIGAPRMEQGNPSVGLPEVRRMSSFGADFLENADSTTPKDTSAPHEPSLHHNPSSGFRSVVHQAFDVPETPQSTTTSVTRSNSDGTSTISPIIGGRSMTDERTPTIPEEPNESSPKAGASAGPVFNPGHRRDLSLPSSDNSPSRKPQVTDQTTPTAGHAEFSSILPPENFSPQSTETGMSPQNPSKHAFPNNGQDLPAPLKFGSTSGPDSFHGEIPTIRGPEESPQNADNDRLREEIIRSLSREATPSEDPEQSNQPQSQGPPGSIPHQYERYWDGQTGPGPDEGPKALVSESHPDWSNSHPLAPKNPYSNSPGVTGNSSSTIVDQPKKPKLERRFSWESSDEEEESAPQIPGSYSSPPPLGTSLAIQEPEPIKEEPSALSEVLPEPLLSDNEGSDTQRATRKPRLSLVLPVSENNTPPEQIMGPGTTPPQQPQTSSDVGTTSLDESKLLGFRDILGITSINQRIKSFEHTRDQFASLDTGLNNWLQFVVHEHPEHAGVVQQSQSLSPTVQHSPTRSRFPKLGSLANLASNDGTPASTSHMRRPSGHLGTVMNREKVGEKGKELLHTAGAFSGKASGAAKGLFAKGRSKFRPSGGPDKGQSAACASSAPRHSSHFSFPTGSVDVFGNSSSLRNSVNLGSLPAFKPGRIDPGAGSDPAVANLCLDGPQETDAHKPVNAARSGDIPVSHDRVGKTGVQPKQVSVPPAVPPKNEVSESPGFARDFEQEMIAALGLSPKDPRPQRSISTPLALNMASQVGGDKMQFTEPSRELPEGTTGIQSAPKPPVKKAQIFEKSLPVVPNEPFHVAFPDSNSQSHQPSKSIPDIVTPSIRPVLIESTKPPSPPPKDNDNRLIPDEGHKRQFSVSTLGADEQGEPGSDDEVDREPPSPLQETANEVAADAESNTKVDHSVNRNSDPSAEASTSSLPSVQQKRKSFIPFYPSGSTSSAETRESKKKSTRGLPLSSPNVHSPLRNEVRNSPGTRSSMLSFGSFGKLGANKGSRPVTPATGLSQASEPAATTPNEESTIGKLKNFGRRRRASVGDLLSTIQSHGSQGAPAGQRKRTFSRFSVLFSRQDAQEFEKKPTDHTRTASEPLRNMIGAIPPAANGNLDTLPATQTDTPVLHNPFDQKAQSPQPLPPNIAEPSLSDTSQRSSRSLAPNPSPMPLVTGGRFYSQFRSASMNDPLTGALQAGVLSPPLPGQSRSPSPMSVHENKAAQPLSPLEELQDHQIHQLQKEEQHKQKVQQPEPQDSQLGVLSENQEQEEHEEHKDSGLGDRLPQELYEEAPETQTIKQDYAQQRHEVRASEPEQTLASQPNAESQKPASASAAPSLENNPRGSKTSMVSSHPHRSEDEARMVNDSPQPVELAVTADDSSEEIVMSPTSYPGQEWMPVYY